MRKGLHASDRFCDSYPWQKPPVFTLSLIHIFMQDHTLWALTKKKPEAGLWMERVPVPEVGPNDVKIKIHKTAICGTDVHIYQWNEWAQHTIPIGLSLIHISSDGHPVLWETRPG